jgi:FkbM family methyltransferase
MYAFVAKAPNYIRRFGPLHGLRLLCQIERRLPPGPPAVRRYRIPGLPGPIALRPTVADHAAFWQCLVRNQYDVTKFPHARRLLDAYRDHVSQGRRPLVLDCGANIGLASVWFAAAFPQAHICAIEPDQGNFSLLTENTWPFRDRATLIRGAVWGDASHVRISNPGAGSAAFRVEPAPSSDAGAIEAYTVGQICKRVGAPAPFIVKLDIEGAQKDVFARNAEWVGETHLIALELDDWLLPWQGTSRPFFSCVSQHPFEYLMSGETLFCFRDFEAQGRRAVRP